MTIIFRTVAERFGRPNPFGWFAIARSAELGDAEVRYSSMSSRLPTSRGEMEGKITVRPLGPGLSFTRF